MFLPEKCGTIIDIPQYIDLHEPKALPLAFLFVKDQKN